MENLIVTIVSALFIIFAVFSAMCAAYCKMKKLFNQLQEAMYSNIRTTIREIIRETIRTTLMEEIGGRPALEATLENKPCCATSTVYASDKPMFSQVSLVLPAHEWSKLQNTRVWKDIAKSHWGNQKPGKVVLQTEQGYKVAERVLR